MAETRLYLDMRNRAKDGKGSVRILITHNGSGAFIPTGIRVSQECWRMQRVVRLQDASTINARLQEQKAAVDRRLAELSMSHGFASMTALELKNAVSEKSARPDDPTVASVFGSYVSSAALAEKTRVIYSLALKKVIAFGGQSIRMSAIDLQWLRRFDAFLAETQGINGRSIYMRALRAVCNYARRTGAMKEYPFDGFHIRQEETRKRSLSIGDLRRLLDYPVTGTQRRYRDYFFLIFCLIGINAKDLLLARKSQVIDGRLEYTRAKTGKKYSILIQPEAAGLIARHAGKGEWLLDAMDSCEHYASFAREINESLQTVGPVTEEEIPVEESLFADVRTVRHVEPLFPDITTYWARHSWATIAHSLGVSFDVISLALGHSFANRTTMIYIRPDMARVDEANRMVLDAVTGVRR